MVVFRLTGKPAEARAFWGLLFGCACLFSGCHDLEQHADAPPGGSSGVAGLPEATPSGGTAAGGGVGVSGGGAGGLESAAGDSDGGAAGATAGGAAGATAGGAGVANSAGIGGEPSRPVGAAGDAGSPGMQNSLVPPSWITWLSSDLI